jgi:hypothetical protein
MAKTKISEFDSTPANNTDIDSINIAEGCAPSGINNAIRELMSQLKDQQTGASSDNFTVGGNLAVTGTSAFTGNAAFVGSTTFTGAVVMSSATVSSGITGNVTGNVTGNLLSITNTITSGSFIVGNIYVIATLGTTDFTLIGASANTVGIEFTASGVGTGTGTATTVTGRASSLSSTLPVTKGGTGNSSVTPNAVFIGGSTSTSAILAVKPGTLGNILKSTAGSTITAGSFVVGIEYSILTLGSTDFTLIGASANTIGVVFTATGVGVGSGTAQITTWSSSTAPTAVKGLGLGGEVWNDVAGSRGFGSTYTNSRSYPIAVSATATCAVTSEIHAYVDGVLIAWYQWQFNGCGSYGGTFIIVPPGKTYRLDSGQSVYQWKELY